MRKTILSVAVAGLMLVPPGFALAQDDDDTGPDSGACVLAEAELLAAQNDHDGKRQRALSTRGVAEADLTQAEVDRLSGIADDPEHPNALEARLKLDVIVPVVEAAALVDARAADRDDACAPVEPPADDEQPGDDEQPPADDDKRDERDERVCADFDSQAAAQAAYAFGNEALDVDGDGIACEQHFDGGPGLHPELADNEQVDVIPAAAPETGGR